MHMDEPTYFMVTGMPKSGNKWLNRMVFMLDEVGGYADYPRDGLPLLAQKVWEHQPIHDFCRENGRSFEAFFRRLLNPNSSGWDPLTPEQQMAMGACITRFVSAARRNKPGGIEVEPKHFAHLLGPDHDRESTALGRRAFGTAGMHVPLRDVADLLPGFRIIHLMRDPRDITVSYCYHLIATMNTRLSSTFVERRGGELVMRDDWKKRFATRAIRRFERFFDDAPRTPLVLDVRYEDLLMQSEVELDRVGQFLGVSTDAESRLEIARRNSFEAKTGGTGERRNSMTRKGKSGDWRNYFDRELVDALGPKFRRVVRDLGYESDDSWVDTVPAEAPQSFEFSRFRIRRSTCRHFIDRWMASPELQTRFRDPWDFSEGDTFYHWLREQSDPEIVEWNELADALEALWEVDIVEVR